MKTFSILTPSRNRPDRLEQFIDSVFPLALMPENIEMLVYIDLDDPAIIEYRNLESRTPHNVLFTYGEHMSISKSWNILAAKSVNSVLIMGNDDLLYRTVMWDTKLEEELAVYIDDIYCAWMEDKINGKSHCAFPIVSRLWYETLGYFAPGVFNFGYNDTWVFDIAQRIDRCHFIPHIVAEHMHFSAKKATYDDTYARNRTQERGNLYHKDKDIYEATREQRHGDAQKLLAVIRSI